MCPEWTCVKSQAQDLQVEQDLIISRALVANACPATGGRRLLNCVTSLLDVVVVRDQNWNLSPNCMMRGSAAVRICPNVALLSVVFGLPGRSQLSALNASTRASIR